MHRPTLDLSDTPEIDFIMEHNLLDAVFETTIKASHFHKGITDLDLELEEQMDVLFLRIWIDGPYVDVMDAHDLFLEWFSETYDVDICVHFNIALGWL